MDIWNQGALELAAALRRREISAVELLDLYLDRIEKYNPALNAIVVFDTEAARGAAQRGGLLAANDLSTALRRVVGGEATVDRVLGSADALDVLHFWLSPACVAIRHDLGLSS